MRLFIPCKSLHLPYPALYSGSFLQVPQKVKHSRHSHRNRCTLNNIQDGDFLTTKLKGVTHLFAFHGFEERYKR